MTLTLPAIDGNAPSFKTVFKAHDDARKAQAHTCDHCRTVGSRRLSVCGRCLDPNARYCSKEHQRLAWPKHKTHCQQHPTGQKSASGRRPSITERKRTLKDWAEVHKHSIEQALTSLASGASPQIDLHRQHVEFTLVYRAESQGNPSTAFILKDARIENDPLPGETEYDAFQSFRSTMAGPESKTKNQDPNYVGSCLTVYTINGEVSWQSCSTLNILSHDIPKFPGTVPDRRGDWLYVLQYFIDHGLVFRCVGPTLQFWLPGLMERTETGWLWSKRTTAQLREHGILLKYGAGQFQWAW